MGISVRLAMVLLIACHPQAPVPIASTTPPPPHHAVADCTDSMFHRCGRTVVSSTSIEILERVHFIGNTAAIDPKAHRTLDAIAESLKGNPSIKAVEVSAFGGPSVERRLRQALGDRRAEVIVDYLIMRGVEPTRLTRRGIAEAPPGASDEPRFVIVWRVP